MHADADENPDLYWAVRGGGGNFGVVTYFEFGLHPMQREVVAGAAVFPIDRARELLAFYGEFSSSAPEELQSTASCARRRAASPACFSSHAAIPGRPATPNRVLAPIRKLGKPLADTFKARSTTWRCSAAATSTDPRNEGSI